MLSIVVDDKGTTLSYIDSGMPAKLWAPTQRYITIFAIHGTYFTSPIFEKVMSLANEAGVRFVAINRRDYPGSTPYSAEELAVLTSGTEEEKETLSKTLCSEIASFIERFVENNGLLPISADGKSGGIALLGWSLGCSIVLSTLAHIDSLSATAQARWGLYMRSLILQEPSPAAIGMPLPPQAWSPRTEPSIPDDLRGAAFTRWITSYFQHGDLSKRDPDVLSHKEPATSPEPTISTMSAEDIARIVHELPGSKTDMLFTTYAAAQFRKSYQKALFDHEIRAMVPHMKVLVFTGDMTVPFSLPAFWALQDDSKRRRGSQIKFRIVQGINHFVHWADPSRALQIYLDAIQ